MSLTILESSIPIKISVFISCVCTSLLANNSIKIHNKFLLFIGICTTCNVNYGGERISLFSDLETEDGEFHPVETSMTIAFQEIPIITKEKIDTFSVEFENNEYDESNSQKKISKFINSNHRSELEISYSIS